MPIETVNIKKQSRPDRILRQAYVLAVKMKIGAAVRAGAHIHESV